MGREGRGRTLVEVKTTGYLQSWTTKALSTPSWTFRSVRADLVWSEVDGDYVPVEPAARVHVRAVALQTAQDLEAYEPLDVGQWQLRVMPHRELLASGQTSARLSSFEGRTPPVAAVAYTELAAAVADTRVRNDALAG